MYINESNAYTIYDEAVAQFEQCNYEKSLDIFINLYNKGFFKDNIIDIIYDCFITPNEEEFKKNYDSQSYYHKNVVPYNDLSLDFIPISDSLYYVFNKNDLTFPGKINLAPPDNHIKKFESILFSDSNNILSLFEHCRETEWQNVYVILPDSCKSSNNSFFKLENTVRFFINDNIYIFHSEEEYTEYISGNPDKYIPKLFCGNDSDRLIKINQNLHKYRLENSESHNVFLTIAIPTFNRGNQALESVKNILSSNYDSEIEILISDNGSDNNTEGYKEISEINDSRVTYFRSDLNMNFHGNINNVLSIAKGKYIMTASDEDSLFVQNLPSYMEFIYQNPSCGVYSPSGIGENLFPRETEVISDKKSRLSSVFHLNYVTGITFNAKVLKEQNAFIKLKEQQDKNNYYSVVYPHTAYALISCENNNYSTSEVILWDSKENVRKSQAKPILEYMRPESRLFQQDSAIQLIHDLLPSINAEESYELILNRLIKTYYLLWFAFDIRTEAFLKEYDWLDICIQIFNHNMEYINKTQSQYDSDHFNMLHSGNLSLFHTYICKNPAEKLQSSNELLEFEERRDILLKAFE